MKDFFKEELFLSCPSAVTLYQGVKDLPIIDYHCHLDQKAIAENRTFADIGEFWLAADHYKWRSMRLCGVEEYYITGKASYKEKFLQYAKIMPKLVGSPLYYWTHMELRAVFGITLPLGEDTAEEIYREATEKLRTLSVQKLLTAFGVEALATTDDPVDDLACHGVHGGVKVAPTFRPDKAYCPTDEYLAALEKAVGTPICSLSDFTAALCARLDFFTQKGCFIADHGFEFFPNRYANKEEAEALFLKRNALSAEEKDALFGYLLLFLMKEYKKRNITAQLHFAVKRNVNRELFAAVGADSGIDIVGEAPKTGEVLTFLQQLSDSERPNLILYPLNDASLPALTALSGAFARVKIGAAWWFNDTVEGIRRNLTTLAEYAVLGTSYGMLTDSRSFSSYCRFDFFRRILCDFLGRKVEAGECALSHAQQTAADLCYYNAKELIK